MKRLISIVLVCLMIMALAACGNTSDKPATGTTPDTTQTPTGKGTVTDRGYTIPDEDVTIRFSWWGGDEELKQHLLLLISL